MKYLSGILLIFLILVSPILAQRRLGVRPTDTGGPLSWEQASYDIKAYDIAVSVNPADQSISGVVTITAKIVSPINVMALDLDTPFSVTDVSMAQPNGGMQKMRFERPGDKVRAYFPMTKQPDEWIAIRVTYSGKPRIAPAPPWVGGFMWKKTADGSPWIANATQNDGVDTWIPAKDHPSDKADVITLHITVPQPLVVASIGRLQKVDKNADGTQTYHWQMTNPISNYEIVLNIAPYKTVEGSFRSMGGDTFPVTFWVLPEHQDKAAGLIEETKKYLTFFERYLGPYPFRSQKLGIAETPHLGMEHSTIIAYGNEFKMNDDGFDGLMFHELGHEWWGNLVTASDWRDFWIHEGFQSFMDDLYVEHLKGREAYLAHMAKRFKATRNKQPVAPRDAKIAYQVYMAAPKYVKGDGDIYGKGACFLHTLRYLIGEDAFFRALRRMAYPTKEMEAWTDGRQRRFANTDDFLTIAEEESKMNLDWFFELYLRQPKLPKLKTDKDGGKLVLRWETPGNMPFPMPVDVEMNGKTRRVEMPNGTAAIDIEGSGDPVFDPKGWVLKVQKK